MNALLILICAMLAVALSFKNARKDAENDDAAHDAVEDGKPYDPKTLLDITQYLIDTGRPIAARDVWNEFYDPAHESKELLSRLQ